AVAGQLARRQGRRRGGHDRLLAGGGERDGRRAPAARRDVSEHAAQSDARVGGDPGGEGMIPVEFDYAAPDSLDEAIRLLAEGGDDAKPLAGGHSLIPLMKLRIAAPALLVDLRKVPGLHGIQRENGSYRIGSMVTHAEL